MNKLLSAGARGPVVIRVIIVHTDHRTKVGEIGLKPEGFEKIFATIADAGTNFSLSRRHHSLHPTHKAMNIRTKISAVLQHADEGTADDGTIGVLAGL